MKKPLTLPAVERLVQDTAANFPHEECRTCDCFHGFLTQLVLDVGEDVSPVIDQFKIDRDQMHGCLGCDPCPPGSAFARYLKQAQKRG